MGDIEMFLYCSDSYLLNFAVWCMLLETCCATLVCSMFEPYPRMAVFKLFAVLWLLTCVKDRRLTFRAESYVPGHFGGIETIRWRVIT